MPITNENLIRAFVCDLEETDKVTKDIISYVGKVDTYSWKFPSCRGDDIELIPLCEGFVGSMEERYLFLMELLVDRLNFFLHALMKYLETFPVSFVKAVPCPYVTTSSFLSFGALIHSTWDKLKTIYNGFADNMEKSIFDHFSKMDDARAQHTLPPNEVFEKCSQTAVISLNHCENCHSSMKIVRVVVNCIENMFKNMDESNESDTKNICKESSVSKLKNEIKHELWEVSQWKVMSQMAEAVTMDTNVLEEQLANCISEKYSLLKELKIGRGEISSLNNEKENLIRDITTISNRNSDLLESNVKLVKMLSKKENEVKSLMDLLNESKTSNENLRRDNEDTAEQLLKCQLELKKFKEELEMKSNEVCIFKKKYMDELQNRKRVQEEVQAVRAGVEHLEEELVAARRNADILVAESEGERIQFLFQIQELQGNLERTKTEKVSLAMDLQQLREEQSGSLNEICKLKSRLQEQKEEVILLSKYPNFFEEMDSELIGIPEVDMENQIKANNIRIKLLHDENAALGHTIWKLKIKGQETPAGRGMERN